MISAGSTLIDRLNRFTQGETWVMDYMSKKVAGLGEAYGGNGLSMSWIVTEIDVNGRPLQYCSEAHSMSVERYLPNGEWYIVTHDGQTLAEHKHYWGMTFAFGAITRRNLNHALKIAESQKPDLIYLATGGGLQPRARRHAA